MSTIDDTSRDPLYERIVDRLARWLTYLLPAVGSALVIYICWPLLAGEQSVAWDDLFHQSTERLTAETMANGRNPFGLLPAMFGLPAFRFYQGLHYVVAGGLQLMTGAGTLWVHNWLITLVFAATPWTFRRFCVAVGISPIAAGAAGLLYVTSINGTSNSFESYFECAFLTQVLASAILPLALASLATLVRQGRGPIRCGVLMGLTILAHAMYAIYAALAAALLVVAYLPRELKTWAKLGAAAALAGVLAMGWMIPFVQYQTNNKPVTDMVSRADRFIWFTGLDPAEMGRFLVSGRLLDGGSNDGSQDAFIEAKINMTSTRKTRLPFLTILGGVGLLFALIGFRRPENRFLIGGLATGLLFMLGSDDLPGLLKIPLVNKIQAFRATYFVELFAIALAGQAVARLGRVTIGFFNKGAASIALKTFGGLCVGALALTVWATTVHVVTPLMDTWDVGLFDRVRRVLDKAGPADPQQRVLVKFRQPGRKFRYALEHWLEVNGRYRSMCNHWTGLSSTINLHTCAPINAPWRAPGYARLMGIRYMVIGRRNAASLTGEDSKHPGEYKKLGRVGKLAMVEDLEAEMLHNAPGARVLTVATPAQWYWAGRAWIKRFGHRVGQPAIPWLLHAPPSALEDEAILEQVDAVLYLDDSRGERDRDALAAIAGSGKPLLLSREIDGVEARVFETDDPSWNRILRLKPRQAPDAKLERLDGSSEPDRLRYRVVSPEPALLVLSMEHFANWQATADGEPLVTFAAGPNLVGVIAPAGEHEFEFAYEWSSTETATFWISSLGWIAVLGFGLFVAGRGGWRWLQKRRKKS